MKIEPSLPKPPRPTGTEGRGPAGHGFADLVGGPDGRERVASFAELPVFGRPHATAARATAVPSAQPVPAGRRAAEPPARPIDPPCAAGQAPGKAGRALPAAAAAPRCPSARPLPVAPDVPVLPERAVARDAGPQSAEAPVDGDRPRRARQRARQAAPKPGISLILTEKDGEVSLVVGQHPLDPEQCAEARRIAARVLAESGLALTHFQLNGAALGPDSTGRKGGNNGTRSG